MEYKHEKAMTPSGYKQLKFTVIKYAWHIVRKYRRMCRVSQENNNMNCKIVNYYEKWI